MALDIDNFLDNNFKEAKEEKKKEEIKTPIKKEEEKKDLGLDFQQEIEKRLEEARTEAEKTDLHFLRQIYDEVKRFDQDLPQKFFGIEKKSSLVLRDLGAKYTTEFLKKSEENAKIVSSQLKTMLLELDKDLSKKNYGSLLKNLQETKHLYYRFPRGFVKEKSAFAMEIKEVELRIYDALEQFTQQKIQEVKSHLKKEARKLQSLLSKEEPVELDRKITEIDHYLYTLPKLLLSHLTKEKKEITELTMNAEARLEELSTKEFQKRTERINELFKKFQNAYLKKELERCTLIYDEILRCFERIPDIYLDKKLKLYEQIQASFSAINTLVLNNNVSIFLDAYKNSKTIEEVRTFLSHSRKLESIDSQNLELIVKKIESLPDDLKEEKDELLKEMESLVEELMSQNDIQKPFLEKEDEDTDTAEKEEDPRLKINKLYHLIKTNSDAKKRDKAFSEIKELLPKTGLEKKEEQTLLAKIEESYTARKGEENGD